MNQNPISERQHWMKVLAQSPVQALADAWNTLTAKPDYYFLRQPETGLVMVQARTNGTGAPFNMGEVSVTRCAVSIAGNIGHSYIRGRNKLHAELAAVFDGLLLHPDFNRAILDNIISPLAATLATKNEKDQERAESTRVEFFTMVRGED